jgi:ParB-like chromosome segregation protein Spo0J
MIVKVSHLTHHPLNKEIYELSTIDELMDSISTVGLLQPLTIDQHHQVVSGNRRLEAIRRLGWEEVPVNQIHVPSQPIYGVSMDLGYFTFFE